MKYDQYDWETEFFIYLHFFFFGGVVKKGRFILLIFEVFIYILILNYDRLNYWKNFKCV